MSTGRHPHWAQLGEHTFTAGLWFLYGVYRLVGRLPFLVFLYPVVMYYRATRPVARRASLDYLRRIEKAHGAIGTTPRWYHGMRHFLHFGDAILFKTLAVSGRYRFDTLAIEGDELVEQLIAQGRGGVFVTGHIGCVELCQAIAVRRGGVRLNVLVHSRNAERFSRILQRLSPHSPLQLIEITDINPGTAMMLAEKVARGEFIALTGDRVPLQGGQVVHADFLGEPAPYPVGPYVLAALLQCPLLLMSCLRTPQGHRVRVECLADKVELPRAQRAERLAHYVSQYAQRIEQLMAQTPYEWFNFYPFWDQPAARPAHTSHEKPTT